MTDQQDQRSSDDLATGAAGADQEAWEGADIDTAELVSSDQTTAGPGSDGSSQTVDGTGSEDAAPDEEQATEEAVETPEPSTELDAPLAEGERGDADGSTDHQPESGPASEATDDAREVYDTAPD
ncbi:hypothetical protein [Plantibacter sp. VKM Ac-2876]|uniref:hypothetical protein n=1 Tax=Plantibacter sp. VKM Ac-2876 TaxID=2783826 RepID=UPI00188A4CEE|nr:hypothetical protein [Plantibacter sp. VKM Ac-2876]MBF4566066.1 hypothetical protein [Plantibacter sp. VKM Ac-2876]